MDYRGRNALITGASSGIGAAFAEALAARGASLMLVARREERLRDLARRLSAEHGVRAEFAAADLAAEGMGLRIAEESRRRLGDTDVLINNAGFGTFGPFHAADRSQVHAQVMLNAVAVADLAHELLPGMAERGRGVVINVASTAAFQPVAYMATYGATKAFVLSLSEALWAEYRRYGVRVLALCPGPTGTEFFDVVGTSAFTVGRIEPPELVVRRALSAVDRGKSTLVSGLTNLLLSELIRITPRAVVASMSEKVMRPKLRATAERA